MSVSATQRRFHRDGTSQRQRRLAEIDPLYAKLDDRDLKDLLAFFWRMAESVRYYDAGNRVSGHWQGFLGVEKAVLLAAIATHDTSAMKRDFLDRHVEIRRRSDPVAYQVLFDLLYEHCLALKTLYERTRDVLGGEILLSPRNRMGLTSFGARLLALYRRHRGADDYVDDFTEGIEGWARALDLDLTGIDTADVWEVAEEDAFYANLPEALYGLHQDLLKLFGTIISHAEQQLRIELSRHGDFQPHVGLIMSFLALFRRHQDQLNGLTARHLMFYYRDILKIDFRPRIPDRVHLIVEPAKHVETCRLTAGTRFSAGKDVAGRPLVYTAVDELVANRAQVTQLKSLYRYGDLLADDGTPLMIGSSGIAFRRIKAAVMADSLDGNGTPLDMERPQFHPFGGSDVGTDAELGFALAGPILRLTGGRRVITLTVELEETQLTEEANMTQVLTELEGVLPSMFELRLSCDEGWRVLSRETPEVEGFTVRSEPAESSENPQLKMECTLPVQFPAVVDVSAALHDDSFPEGEPVCQVVLRETDDGSLYELCRRMTFVTCELQVEVSQVRDLILQNDFGTLKPEKPMMVFGHAPRPGAAFYIGQAEALSKSLTRLSIAWDWIDFVDDLATHYAGYTKVPEGFPTVRVSFERLVDNAWQPIDADAEALPLFYVKTPVDEGEGDAEGDAAISDVHFTLAPRNATNAFKGLEPTEQYSLAVQDGFIRMILRDESGFAFGQANYAASLTNALSATSTVGDDGVVTISSAFQEIQAPVTPTIQNVQLAYESSASLTVGQGSDDLRFFHLHPFGVHRRDVGTDPNATAHPLVHDIPVEGALYIGLEGLVPPQSLSLLLQFVEGTGDQGLPLPDDLHWSYLTESGWRDFDERGVAKDGTKGLSGSGIVALSLPAAAVSHSSVMPVGCFWIRVSVPNNSRAVNKLTAVTAQALEVVLRDEANDPSHYAQPLAAGTIAKLVESDPCVKAVTQPFASFGGRPPEGRDSYIVRASERLRHKDRAVTQWDYERLVLEHFPRIHKVTCLNHHNREARRAPGHVLVIVIPKLENLNAVNLLQPSVSLGLREEIQGFLEARCSTFVELHVANPTFESLKVIADVTFHTGFDTGFYNRQLSDDIRDFLTPWKQDREAIRFYERLHTSVILNFIEERPYVDYLTRFLVQKRVVGDNAAPEPPIGLGDIVRGRPDALFVSVKKHAINEIAEE